MAIHLPYIGVTGFATARDVADTAPRCVALVPPGYRLMAGVLVSAKTLRGESPTRRRYPARADVEPLLAELLVDGAWPVVHYNTRATGAAFLAELRDLVDLFPSMRGLQLNVVRPDPDVLWAFLHDAPAPNDLPIILQMNGASVAVDGAVSPRDLVAYAAGYSGIAAHALLDLSGGRGTPLDAGIVVAALGGWPYDGPRPGVAGGLDGQSARSLRGLACAQRVSCDAESRLRTHDDDLNGDAAVAYVRAAAWAIGGGAL